MVKKLMHLANTYFNFHGNSPASNSTASTSIRSPGNSTIITNDRIHYQTPPMPKRALLDPENADRSISKRIHLAKAKDKVSSLIEDFPQQKKEPHYMHHRKIGIMTWWRWDCAWCARLFITQRRRKESLWAAGMYGTPLGSQDWTCHFGQLLGP